ncbi:helix-turn-helix domain-containing protein [Streptomyces sp. NPDC101227]|uniref:helix-turn-helix domain-containing protein n=1 Tax=Streptomyces sp. NPDC101227 TaxID=3366136 RepID=UPI00382C4519
MCFSPDLKRTDVVARWVARVQETCRTTERELSRRTRHRPAVLRHVEKVSGGVAATCRYYGISRQYCYIWRRRYEAEGQEGLKDRSSAAHHTPHATQADVAEKILWLCRQYHFGQARIAMYLERYHDVKVSSSGVWRILKKVGVNRLPASQRYKCRPTRWKRYGKQRPGHQLQADVKFIEPLGQTPQEALLPVHRHRRLHRLRVPRAYSCNDRKTTIQFVDQVPAKLPFAVEQIQTDNGQEFGSTFHGHLLDKGIGHVCIRHRRT